MPGYMRQAHFFSRTEWYIAVLCLWLGAFDVREQFPLWPMDHKHPLSPETRVWKEPDIEGLWWIAERAGIRHGFEVGSDGVPYIATLDVMCTLGKPDPQSLAGIAIKPYDEVTLAEPTDRLMERLELQRRYMRAVDGSSAIASASLLTAAMQGNLDVYGRYASVQPLCSRRVADFLAFIEDVSPRLEQSAAVRLGARASGLALPEAQQQLAAAIWHRRIDVDITEPIRLDLPLPMGGYQMAARLQQELFGRIL